MTALHPKVVQLESPIPFFGGLFCLQCQLDFFKHFPESCFLILMPSVNMKKININTTDMHMTLLVQLIKSND